jgi:Bor protein
MMHVHSTTRSIRCALLATLVATGAIGCYKATFIANPQVVRGADHDQWNSFFLWGLVGEETLDVRQFCSGGQVAQVRTGANFLTGLVSFVTIGIYAPRMAYVWCAAGHVGPPRAALAPNESAAATPASDSPTLSIYADRRGRPVRVELRHNDALDAVATPTAVKDEPRRWHVAFAPEVAR